MATETFDKTIYIDEQAAEIMVRELEKPRKPYKPERNIDEIIKDGTEWLKQRESLLKKSSKQGKK